MEAICAANNQLGLDIVAQLNNNQNAVLSPLSILSALSMVYLGARGNTASQMKKVLHFGNIENVHSGFEELLSSINGSADYTLNIANRLFGEKSFTFYQAYLNKTKQFYQSELEKVDFANNPEPARQHINKWVEQQTNGKILNLLPEKSISKDTRLVITNAIYLMANWTHQFPKLSTHNATFTLSNNENVTVKMMSTRGRFNYYSARINDKNVQIVELPYGKNSELSMFIILPDSHTSLTKLEKNLSHEIIGTWTKPENMAMREVIVNLPRFRVESSAHLKDILSSLGMNDLFNSRANLSAIAERNLYAQDAYHKAFVKVDEDGTEAAAATAIVLATLTNVIHPSPIEFKVNRPFIFVIQHKPTKCVLFYGRVEKP